MPCRSTDRESPGLGSPVSERISTPIMRPIPRTSRIKECRLASHRGPREAAGRGDWHCECSDSRAGESLPARPHTPPGCHQMSTHGCRWASPSQMPWRRSLPAASRWRSPWPCIGCPLRPASARRRTSFPFAPSRSGSHQRRAKFHARRKAGAGPAGNRRAGRCSPLPLDRLDKDRRHLIRRANRADQRLHAFKVAVASMVDIRNQRGKTPALHWLGAGKRHRAVCSPMKRVHERDRPISTRMPPASFRAASIASAPLLVKKTLFWPDPGPGRQPLGQSDLRRIVKIGARHVNQAARLPANGRHDPGVRVPDVRHHPGVVR